MIMDPTCFPAASADRTLERRSPIVIEYVRGIVVDDWLSVPPVGYTWCSAASTRRGGVDVPSVDDI